MHELMTYGISSLMACFVVLTFILSRLPTDIFPEDYEFHLDPFWYIIGVLFLGSSVIYFIFPQFADTIKAYSYLDILLPIVFAILIYCSYLFNVGLVINVLVLGSSLAISFLQPDTFQLFPQQLTPLQDKLVVALILFVISKGMGLLNGLGGIAAMQFSAVMMSGAILAYFGALPCFLGVLALTYLGTMLAFAFFSWPPEKIIISNGAFCSLGFVMGCFMLNAATEYAEAPMLIAISYMITEIGIALYNHFINRFDAECIYMNTSYFRTSKNGVYEQGVALGVLKILVIDVVLSMVQIAASERLALAIFAVALNLWFLSILSGETKPSEVMSLTKLGRKAVKKLWSIKKKDKASK